MKMIIKKKIYYFMSVHHTGTGVTNSGELRS